MESVVLIGEKANSRLFFIQRESAESALRSVIEAFKKLHAGDVDTPATIEIRDDYGGLTVLRTVDFRGFTLNASEGDEEVQVEMSISKALAQTKANARVAMLGREGQANT